MVPPSLFLCLQMHPGTNDVARGLSKIGDMRAQRGSGIVRAREDGVVEEMSPKKLEAGRSVMGVEGFPKPTARWTLNRV